jgi:hypothetical protein
VARAGTFDRSAVDAPESSVASGRRKASAPSFWVNSARLRAGPFFLKQGCRAGSCPTSNGNLATGQHTSEHFEDDDPTLLEPFDLTKVTTMTEAQGSTPTENDADECLHCAIVDMVEERIAKGGADVGDLATLVAESLVDLILLVPESDQAKLLAHTVSALGDLFLQKSGAEDGGSGSRH